MKTQSRAVLAAALMSASSCDAFSSTHSSSFVGVPRMADCRLKNTCVDSRSSSSRNVNGVRMHMAPTAAAAVGGVVGGGLFAGGLHAIAGPDHLAALLPRTVGQKWYRAGRTGALWGIGHGISVTILGTLGFALKSRINLGSRFGKVLHGASHCLEAAVGLSLVVIGLMGLKEAREWGEEIEEMADIAPTKSLSAAGIDAVGDHVTEVKNRSVIFNGLLHGFSWDGAPSLAPALAVATWRGNMAFLIAYAAGTMTAMALTTTLIGEGTRRAGAIFHRPDLPQKLSLFSSMLAILIGVVWTGLAFF